MPLSTQPTRVPQSSTMQQQTTAPLPRQTVGNLHHNRNSSQGTTHACRGTSDGPNPIWIQAFGCVHASSQSASPWHLGTSQNNPCMPTELTPQPDRAQSHERGRIPPDKRKDNPRYMPGPQGCYSRASVPQQRCTAFGTAAMWVAALATHANSCCIKKQNTPQGHATQTELPTRHLAGTA